LPATVSRKVAAAQDGAVTPSVSLPRDRDRPFGVYDRKGRCVAVRASSKEAVEAAWERFNALDWNTGQELMNGHRMVQMGSATYTQSFKGL